MRPLLLSLSVVIALLLVGCSPKECKKTEPPKCCTQKFTIQRGVNASHWLSQTTIRGEERAAYMSERDFKRIADMGFDHVRLPVDEEQLWTETGEQEPEAFALLHQAIDWCLENNLKVIVDLHVLRSHHFNVADNRQLWEEDSAQQQFISFWKQLSDKLKDTPLNMVAYEPMNEAVSDNPEDWNKLINWVIVELRKLEPKRTIIMGSNNWQQPGTFPDLSVPENDPNIILSFHYYTPFPLTHYLAPWNPFHRYDGPISYPGQAIDTTLYAGMDEELLELVKWHNGYFDREALEKDIMTAVNVAKKFNLPLYCGEFGAFPTTDLARIFHEHPPKVGFTS